MASLAYCHSGPPVKVFFHTREGLWLLAGPGQESESSWWWQLWQRSSGQPTSPGPTVACHNPPPTARVTYGPRVREMEPCAAFTRWRGGRAGSTRCWRPRRLPGTRSAPWHGTTRQPLVTSTQECQFSPAADFTQILASGRGCEGPPAPHLCCIQGSRPPAGSGQGWRPVPDLHAAEPPSSHQLAAPEA